MSLALQSPQRSAERKAKPRRVIGTEGITTYHAALRAKEPGLARSLVRVWVELGERLTRELRGVQPTLPDTWEPATVETLDRWATAALIPVAVEMMQRAGRLVRRDRKAEVDPADLAAGWPWQGGVDGLRTWLATHSATLVREISQSQLEALRQILTRAYNEQLTVDQLAREIRQQVGLLQSQLNVLDRIREAMTEEGASPEAIERRVKWYARLSRARRARNIARTESATAWYEGMWLSLDQALEAGLIGPDLWVQWWTANDERTCPVCAPLHLQRRRRGELFDGVQRPPRHPSCRCALLVTSGREE